MPICIRKLCCPLSKATLSRDFTMACITSLGLGDVPLSVLALIPKSTTVQVTNARRYLVFAELPLAVQKGEWMPSRWFVLSALSAVCLCQYSFVLTNIPPNTYSLSPLFLCPLFLSVCLCLLPPSLPPPLSFSQMLAPKAMSIQLASPLPY